MPQTEECSNSDSNEGYTIVTAVPIMDGEAIQHANVQDAPAHSQNTGQVDIACAENEILPSGRKQKRKQVRNTNKSLRPQTVVQREPKVRKKHKLAKALAPQAWHPACSVLEGLSAKSTFTEPDRLLSDPLRPSLVGPFTEVSSCVSRMLAQGQSTSLAVIGPQGVGKSLVCWRAAAHAIRESGPPQASVATVHLCGSLHKDELRALKYIARELCQFCGYTFTNSASIDDNIKFLEHVMQKMSREGRHVIFLLEDLECFLQECKSRVLYTLLDLLQRANVRAVVIGISCMISVLDLMEKRARSRFSHKVVVVHAPSSSSSEVENSPEGVLASMLYLNECQNECQKEFAVSKVRQWNASVTAAIADPQMQSLLGCVSMSGMSYNRIQDICRTFCCNVLIETAVQRQQDNDMGSFKRLLHEAVQHIISTEDPIEDILSDCSTLQIHIIEAALRLKQAARKLSFQSIVAEYKYPQTQQYEPGLKYAEQAIWAAFQSLKQKDVLFPVGHQKSSRVALKKQQVDLSISSADMRRLNVT